ncbi:MAG: hypothetical protein A4S17_04080 [Proteobacteria bacterium HN_bin10]|jgi:hypothetical protein|nr:MAG: hypothetical protein A4S17_04080 [Proteobacteria bacterium HN_bin10]
MDMLHDIARWTHVGVGIIAFASLWTAGFSRKGGRLHRRAGAVYVWTMIVVLATAAVLTLTTLSRGQWMGAVFLGYLLTITATALWMGRRALNFKTDAAGYTRGLFLPVGVLNILAAAGAVAVGVISGQIFIAAISAIGFLIGFGIIAMRRKPPEHPRFWLKEHFGGMIGAGIATHIAFASIGLRQLFPDADTSVVTIWPWALPLVVGFAASALAERRYIDRGAPTASPE